MTLPATDMSDPALTADTHAALLSREYSVLLAHYGRVQQRCTEVLAAQARRVASLEAELMRLHAARIIQDTALAQQRETHAALLHALPGLPRRAALARHVDALVERVRGLLADRQGWPLRQRLQPARATASDPSIAVPVFWVHRSADRPTAPHRTALKPAGAQHILHLDGSGTDNAAALESSLAAADLVICQVACISHNAYWRVRDHCKRTGKTCVLVHPPGVKVGTGDFTEAG